VRRIFCCGTTFVAGVEESPSECRFTTRIRLRIVNRPVGFASTTTANTARAMRHRVSTKA